MRPERWQQVDQFFQAALAHAPAERAAFISEACGTDESMRREFEALLAADEQVGSLLEAPAYAVAAPLLAGAGAPDLLGKTVSHYQIISLLGKGGMGEVYRARDTRLERTVALKILPSDLATDVERMRRFVREAKAASALNHPHVAHIYEIGEAAGLSFIAMEYVEGQTLAAKIKSQPLPLNEIMEIGSQINQGDPALFRLRIADRKVEQVASLKNIRRTGGYGWWMGLTPDDSPLILRDIGSEDIYVLEMEIP